MEYHRAQLKRFSKAAMRETRPRAWVVTLLYLLLILVVSGVFTFLSPDPLAPLMEPFTDTLEETVEYAVDTGDIEGALLLFERAMEAELEEKFQDYLDEANIRPSQSEEVVAAGFLLSLLSGSVLLALAASLLSLLASIINVIFGYGYQNYCLGVFRQQSPSAAKLFSAFPRILTVIGASVMVGIFTFLWSLLVTVIGSAAIALLAVLIQSEAVIFPVLAVYLAMLVFLAVIPLRYALTPYIVVEDRTVGVFDAINRSKQLMKRRKLKLFVLQLSFLGWYLLLSFLAVAILLVGILVTALVVSVTQQVLLSFALMGIFGLVAAIAPLPLSIWLMTYEGVSFAGFYHVASFVEPVPVAVSAPEIPVPVTVAAPVEIPAQPAPVVEAPVEAPVETPVEPAPVVEAPVEEPMEPAPIVETLEEIPVEPTVVVETPEEIPAESAPMEEISVEELTELAPTEDEEAPAKDPTE